MLFSVQTARWLAPVAFAIDVAAQIYGMSATPNMKDINDANVSFFTPSTVFLGAFFAPQMLLQIGWLYRLYQSARMRVMAGSRETKAQARDLDIMLHYAPVYVLENVGLAVWMVLWNASMLKTSNAVVLLISLTQLYYMLFCLPHMDLTLSGSVLTNLVCRTFAGIGVLDILHNGSIAYFKDEAPSLAVKIAAAAAFVALSLLSDWIFGTCLVYDLIALAVGQTGAWRRLLGLYALVTATIVIVKNSLRPPYHKTEAEYETVGSDDVSDT